MTVTWAWTSRFAQSRSRAVVEGWAFGSWSGTREKGNSFKRYVNIKVYIDYISKEPDKKRKKSQFFSFRFSLQENSHETNLGF